MNSKQTKTNGGEYQVNFQIYSSSNAGAGNQDRPGTGLSIKKISTTSKATVAPFNFFSNNSSNTIGCAQGALNPANQFPGCLNYTNITDYIQGTILGQGAYATVKLATHKQSGMTVAIKIYDKFKLSSNNQVKKSVSREIKLLALLSNTLQVKPSDLPKDPPLRTKHNQSCSTSMVQESYNDQGSSSK